MRNINEIAKQIKEKTSFNITQKQLKSLADHIEAFNETFNRATNDIQLLQGDVIQWLENFYKQVWGIISNNGNFITENNPFTVISSILIGEVIINANSSSSKLIANHILFPLVKKLNEEVFNQSKQPLKIDLPRLSESFLKIVYQLRKSKELAEVFNGEIFLSGVKNVLPQMSVILIKNTENTDSKEIREEGKSVQSPSSSEKLDREKTKEEKLNEELKQIYSNRKKVKKEDESKARQTNTNKDLIEEKKFTPFKELDSLMALMDEMKYEFKLARQFNEIKKTASYVKIQLLELCKTPAELEYYTAMVNYQAALRMDLLKSKKNLDTNSQLSLTKKELEKAQKIYSDEIKSIPQARESKPEKIEFFGRMSSSLFWSGKRTKITDQFFQSSPKPKVSPSKQGPSH